MDTLQQVVLAKLYDRKTLLTTADLFNNRLDLALEDIDHTRTKTQSPQTNGICERFHKEFYRVTFRTKLHKTIDQLQADLDQWLKQYNEERTRQGRWCYGKTPMQTFIDSVPLAREKMLA
jgi:hypothetical protein